MGRLRSETLDRLENFADRVMDVVEELDRQGRSKRVVEQLAGSGTSSGANAFEADEAMTRKDFAKCLGIVTKELNETRSWLRLVGRRSWIQAKRLDPLVRETEDLKSMFGSTIVRTRRRDALPPKK